MRKKNIYTNLVLFPHCTLPFIM